MGGGRDAGHDGGKQGETGGGSCYSIGDHDDTSLYLSAEVHDVQLYEGGEWFSAAGVQAGMGRVVITY